MQRRKFLSTISGLFASTVLAERAFAAPTVKDNKQKDKNKSSSTKKENSKNNSKENQKNSKNNSKDKQKNSKKISSKNNIKTNDIKPTNTNVINHKPNTSSNQNLSNTNNNETIINKNIAKPSIIENPPQGTVATKLPPCRPPEAPNNWLKWNVKFKFRLSNSESCRVWLPLPYAWESYQQSSENVSWQTNSSDLRLAKVSGNLFDGIVAEWQNSKAELLVDLQIKTAERNFNIANRTFPPERVDILKQNLQAGDLYLVDHKVQSFTRNILQKIQDPLAQANRIYNWIIDNVSYQPTTNENTENLHEQIVLGQFYGNQLKINVFFVSLCRSVGIPARVISGWQLTSSQLIPDNAPLTAITKAEFYIPGYGWIPVDPSLVCQAKANQLANSKISELKKIMFGYWENNWIQSNVVDELLLPRSTKTVPFISGTIIEERGIIRNASSREIGYTVSRD